MQNTELTRVCDRCIRKKVKCDQKRPVCSRCKERAETCSYTAVRRKPGPQPGSLSSRSQRSSGRHVSRDESSSLGPSPPQSDILSQQESDLLERYFDIFQDANPIFSKERFLHGYRNGQSSEELVSTIVTLTAKLTGLAELSLDTRIDVLLSSSVLDDSIIGDSPSLDQFRKACLLALYEFHQFPGHQSWMRIGRLTRMAYRIGLDRLENLRALYPDWGCLGIEEIQEWRCLWWCIYRLDSYSNLSSGTPYLVESDLVNTSLVLDPSHQSDEGLYLPPDSADLWKLLPAISSHPETFLKNIHIVSIAAMRPVGIVSRIYLSRRRQEDTVTQLAHVERHLSALRLALPSGWFNAKRNAFANESHADHHARLITVFHFLMAQLLLSLLGCGRPQDDDWLLSWQRVLEICQDIASIAGQWDSSFCVKVDPAICFIIFTALIFLDLHEKCTPLPVSDLQRSIEHDKTVLRLQLDQFARIWTLPRLLSMSFAGFSESVSGPLSYRHIALILSRFEAPLHPRWLQFLSSAQAVLEACP